MICLVAINVAQGLTALIALVKETASIVARHFCERLHDGGVKSQTPMRNGFLLSCVLALAMLGGGYWMGKHSASKHATAPATESGKTGSAATGTPALPQAKKSPVEKPPPVTTGKISLSEIEARIRTLGFHMGRFRDS